MTNYFGNPEIERDSFELKSLDDAVTLRNHILRLFERAAWTDDEDYRRALTTLVVVGGGPTGLETCGALCELYEHVLRKEYAQPHAAHRAGRGAGSAADAVSAERFSSRRYQQLESLGVEVILGNARCRS